MPALKYKVELKESERTHLKEIASPWGDFGP